MPNKFAGMGHFIPGCAAGCGLLNSELGKRIGRGALASNRQPYPLCFIFLNKELTVKRYYFLFYETNTYLN